MIHEYLILLSYFILAFILFIIAKTSTILKEQIFINELDSEKIFPANINKYNTYLFNLISVFLLCRLLIFIFIPNEIYSLNNNSSGFISFYIVMFLAITFWLMLLFFLNMRKNINDKNMYSFISKIYRWGALLAIFDIIGTSTLYYLNFKNLFMLQKNDLPYRPLETFDIKNQILVLIFITIILIIFLFIRFMLKREINIIRNYWLAVFILFILLVIFFIKVSVYKLGWYDSSEIRLKLFTWQYSYLGWIFLLFVVLSLFYNLSAIILLSFKNFINNSQHSRQIAIHLIKMGFISILIVSVLFVYSGY